MIIDKNTLLSGSYSSGTWTGDAVTTSDISENVLDLGDTTFNTLRNMGQGKPLYLVILVKDAVTRGAGAATVTFSLESDSTANLATSATVHWTSSAISKANLTAGTVVARVALPVENTYERYLGVRYTVSATLDAGSFIAVIVDNPDAWVAVGDAMTIGA